MLEDLSDLLLLCIADCLGYYQFCSILKCTSKYLRNIILEMVVPGKYNQTSLAAISYSEHGIIAKRRVKGCVKICPYLNKDGFSTVRTIHFVTSNSGINDGVTPSILRNIAIMKKFNHNNVIKMISADFHNNNIHIITEYMPCNLEVYLKVKLAKLDDKERIRIVNLIIYQLLDVLIVFHSCGFLHRNIKPENIFVVEEKLYNTEFFPRIKLGDFSSSRFIPNQNTCLTPDDPKDRERSLREIKRLHYRAPEMILQIEDYSYSVDIWTIAVIWIELLTGNRKYNII